MIFSFLRVTCPNIFIIEQNHFTVLVCYNVFASLGFLNLVSNNLDGSVQDRKILRDTQDFQHTIVVSFQFKEMNCIIIIPRQSFKAVSYTHLDVYKRQE